MFMTDEIKLAPHFICLGEALTPLLIKVNNSLTEQPLTVIPVNTMLNVIPHKLRFLSRSLNGVSFELKRLNTDVAVKLNPSNDDVYRAVGRLEAVLDVIMNNFREIGSLYTVGPDVEAQLLMAQIYRHSILQIQVFLKDMVDSLVNPKEALQRMGLPRTDSATMEFTLHFSSAPELARLNCWCQLHTVETLDPTPIKQGSGFWGTVGIIAIGLGLS
jgi:hypothetical protein